MPSKWTSRFERKPGRWVYIPTSETITRGNEIKAVISELWRTPPFYYHLLVGGHLSALRVHKKSKYFLHLDIEDYFGKINRSRVTRCLKDLLGYEVARAIASDSTVRHPTDQKRLILPYGFVQSPILSSVSLSCSRLGSALKTLSQSDAFKVSVYVDDIIISGPDLVGLTTEKERLYEAAEKSNLHFHLEKCQGPSLAINAFNIDITQNSMRVSDMRIQDFEEILISTKNPAVWKGIVGYVGTVNIHQANDLAKRFPQPH